MYNMIHPQALIKMFGYNAELVNKQTKGMTHAESLLQLPFEANCFNWILGHIISSRTFALKFVGKEPIWSDEQRTSYKHGSPNVVEDGEGVFHIDKLVSAFNLSQQRLLSGLEQMSYDEMCRLSGYRDNTIGDSMAYFQFHEAHHVGQLLYIAPISGKAGVWLN